jgi:hypothetical protein
MGVARSSYLFLTSLYPLPLLPPHRAPAALPGAVLSGLTERRLTPFAQSSPPPHGQKLVIFRNSGEKEDGLYLETQK